MLEFVALKIKDVESTIKIMEEELASILTLHQSMKEDYRKLQWYKKKLELIKEELRLIKDELKAVNKMLEEAKGEDKDV